MSGLANANAAQLPYADGVFHCVVSSPPYWGLRAYTDNAPQVWGGDAVCKHKWSKPVARKAKTGGVNEFSKGKFFYGGGDGSSYVPQTQSALCSKCGAWLGSYGLEPTLEQYVANTVLIMREVARVLRDDGVLWLNIGDCYATSVNGRSAADGKLAGNDDRTFRDKPFSTVGNGLKPKDMCGVPWRVALALQADGWWLRRDVIWSKPNPMPESIGDRPATSHEYIFMLTKAERYYFDMDAVREPTIWANDPRAGNGRIAYNGKRQGAAGTGQEAFVSINPAGRNLRSVWTIPTQPFAGSHFATFPDTLAERCILASTSAVGVCGECGAPWERVTEPTGHINKREPAHTHNNTPSKIDSTGWAPTNRGTNRFAPTCTHSAPTVPARVFDPFIGSGTTVAAARRLGRHGYGTDLSLTYLRENALPRAMRRSTAQSMATLPMFSIGEHQEQV